MGNGGNWGIGGVGKLHDIFHQVLICPVDRLYDSPIYTDIERFGGFLVFSVWRFLRDIFVETLIWPIDRLYDSPIYTDIERVYIYIYVYIYV